MFWLEADTLSHWRATEGWDLSDLDISRRERNADRGFDHADIYNVKWEGRCLSMCSSARNMTKGRWRSFDTMYLNDVQSCAETDKFWADSLHLAQETARKECTDLDLEIEVTARKLNYLHTKRASMVRDINSITKIARQHAAIVSIKKAMISAIRAYSEGPVIPTGGST